MQCMQVCDINEQVINDASCNSNGREIVNKEETDGKGNAIGVGEKRSMH